MRNRMTRRTLRTLLGLVVPFACGCIPSPRFSGRAFQEKFSPAETAEASLPNGMRVFLERDPQSPVVSIGWMVPAGRTSDPPGKGGLAHLTEHLVFEAPRQGGTTAIEFYDRSGVQFQGETDSAATRFCVTVHRERFAELLKFEKERMSDPLTSLGQAKVRREIRILQEETAALHPHWRQNVMNSLFRALFPQGSPLVTDTDDESLNTLTIDDARQFVATHYRPSSIQLFVVGDFSWAEAQANLGPIERSSSRVTTDAQKLASTESPPPARPAAKIIQHQGFVADNVLKIGWPLPPHLKMVGIEPMLVPIVTSVLPRIEGPSQGKYPAWMPQGALGQKSADLITTPQGSALVVTAQLPPKAEPAKIAAKIINEVDSLALKIAQKPNTFALVQLKVTQSTLRDWVYRVLFAQLRNQSDASYSTATRVNAYSSGTTSMQGTLDVSMDQLESAIALFRDLFNRPREFDEREMAVMKELYWRRVALQNLTGPDIAAEIFDRWSFHMGNPTPLDELKEIRRVGSAELGAIWNVCRQNAVLQIRTNRPLRIRFDN
jgi:predicted Zn-dependent peptidase